ncbi:MAG: hypothetical protein MJZ68_05120 [archaeon]|nr:hypothetical protein [archaeon]
MRDVYFYTDMESLSQLGGSLHVTASADMADLMQSRSIPAVPVRSLFFHLFGFWRTREIRMAQYVTVSNVLRGMSETDDRRWYHGCRKNAYGIMYSVRELEEAGASPEDVPVKDRTSELLKEVWSSLIRGNTSFCYLRRRFTELEDPVKFASALPPVFGGSIPENVVFDGFYRMTPLHERVMGLFEKHGCKVSVAGIADDCHPFVNEVWTKVFSGPCYPDPSEWMYLGKRLSNVFIDLAEYGRPSREGKVRVIRHGSVFDFVKDIGRCMDEGRKVFTSDPKHANRILGEMYPETAGYRLERTSIGRFVVALHRMWSEEDDRILIDREDLITCFSSGWLQINGINGRDHLRSLEAVLPYFERCRTSSDWIERVRSLAGTYKGVLKEKGLYDPGEDRWRNVLGNPLLSFSMFSLSEEEFSRIRALVMRVATLSEELFLNGESTIRDHLEILKGFFTEYPPDLEEERDMMMKAIDRVLSSPVSETGCLPADMADTVPRLIRDEFDDMSDTPRGVAQPLFRIESTVLEGGSPVHLCMCDARSMPGGNDGGRWPLTTDLLRDMVSEEPSLSRMLVLRDCSSLVNRYQMGLLMQNGDVELSWIEETSGGKVGCSPYISLISGNISDMYEPVLYDDYTSIASVTDTNPGSSATRPIETVLNQSLCRYRYIYGYVLRAFPSFDNTFMHGYAAAALIEYVRHTEDKDTDTAKNEVMSLFSNLLGVHRRQMADVAGSSADSGRLMSKDTEYRGEIYSNERLRVLFASPGNEVLRFALLKDSLSPSDMNKVCRYCPSRRSCRFRRV